MREFAFGTDKQFEELDQLLQDNQCHVYNGCSLPECCTPKLARIGFEQNCKGWVIRYTARVLYRFAWYGYESEQRICS